MTENYGRNPICITNLLFARNLHNLSNLILTTVLQGPYLYDQIWKMKKKKKKTQNQKV